MSKASKPADALRRAIDEYHSATVARCNSLGNSAHYECQKREFAAGEKLIELLAALDASAALAQQAARTSARTSGPGQPVHEQAAPVEPVAWEYEGEPIFDGENWHPQFKVTKHEKVAKLRDKDARPLYAHPAAAPKPLHITMLVDWLSIRYRAAGGKEGITDLSAFAEDVMRWTEASHSIGIKEQANAD